MKYSGAVVMMLTLGAAGFADSAPMIPADGGTVRPMGSQIIALRDEVIGITLNGEKYAVEVVYSFENTGEDQEVVMGFPNARGEMTTTIRNFKAFADGKEPAVFQKNALGSESGLFYECFKVKFKKGETKAVRNTYTQEYGTDYNGNFHRVSYILSTGRLWKDKINSIKVTVTLNNLIADQLKNRIAYYSKRDVELGGAVFRGLEVFPNKYKLADNKIEMEFKDLEPHFNLELDFPRPMLQSVDASSTLLGRNISYSGKNAVDGDKSTAWVEGAKGNGVGESITVSVGPNDAGGKLYGAYLIDRIGIVNGYAKDEKTFTENNRVKKIAVIRSYRLSAEDSVSKPVTDVFELADTAEPQTIAFPRPVIASDLTFKILDVYRGAKYEDTCLSEIIVYPYDPEGD